MSTTTLTDTTSSAIATALLEARRRAGSPAMGMVLTLIVVADPDDYDAALADALEAGREHPCRVLCVVSAGGRRNRFDAEIRVGDGTSGEAVILQLAGPVARHVASVVRPLLLPDSPVVVYWPAAAPSDPGSDELGRLANRRIFDSAAAKRPHAALRARARTYSPGDTDLAWTRLTPWRSLLAAALDQYPRPVVGGTVGAERSNASALLLATWLESRLQVPIRRVGNHGPGVTEVTMTTPEGDITLTRPDGLIASYAVPGEPNRIVALRRRKVADLIAEELRRMDPDDVYYATLKALETDGTASTRRGATTSSARRRRSAGTSAVRRAADSTTAARGGTAADKAQPSARGATQRARSRPSRGRRGEQR